MLAQHVNLVLDLTFGILNSSQSAWKRPVWTANLQSFKMSQSSCFFVGLIAMFLLFRSRKLIQHLAVATHFKMSFFPIGARLLRDRFFQHFTDIRSMSFNFPAKCDCLISGLMWSQSFVEPLAPLLIAGPMLRTAQFPHRRSRPPPTIGTMSLIDGSVPRILGPTIL